MIAIPTARIDPYNQSMRALLALLVCLAVGIFAAVQPLVAIALAGLLYFGLRGEGVFRDLLAVLLIGNMALNYGFANVGLHVGGLPLPFTDVVLVALVAWCCLHRPVLREIGLPAVFMVAILAMATLRLIADFPDYRNLAVRDFTTSLETIALVAGFYAYRAYGLKWADRFWLITLLCVMAYAVLFPFRDQIVASSVKVGLQQPVALFGNYSGAGGAVGAAFLFFMLRVRPPLSLLLGAMALALMLLFQARGIYLGVPLAVIIVLVLGERLKTGVASRLVVTVAVGAVLMALIMPLGLQGRMGPVSASFVTSQVGTLLGKEGPGDGSYEDRLKWLTTVREKQSDDPLSLFWGLGLGPDLTGGATGGAEFIRKPHNDYVEIFARFGFLGAVLWAGFFASLLWPVWKGMRTEGRGRNERTFLLWLLASVILYLFMSATQPQLAYAYGTLPLFTLLGMGLALVKGPPDATPDADDAGPDSRHAPVFDNIGTNQRQQTPR